MRTVKHLPAFPLLAVVALATLVPLSHAQEAPRPAWGVTTPYPGLTVRHIVTENPKQNIFAAIIDLKAAKASVRVARGGPDPDGAGPAQTVLTSTTKIAEAENFDLAVNGDYFGTVKPTTRPGEPPASQPGFRPGVASTVIGPAMSDGVLWSTPAKPRPALLVHRDGHVSVREVATPGRNVTQAIAGNVMLVENGKPLYQDRSDEELNAGKFGSNAIRHPRTAAGVDATGTKLILVVVDGRAPEKLAVGMNHKELAKLLADLGAHTALNLDGGGSSSFALRDPATGKVELLNSPGGGKYQRPVANVVGVRFGRP